MANPIYKMAQNVGIMGASNGLEFTEISGYAVDGTGKAIPMYNGMIGVKKERVFSKAYTNVKENNAWVMQAPTATSVTDDTIYLLIADEPTGVEFLGQRHQNLSRRVFGMELSPEVLVRWYKLIPEDFFLLSEGAFANAVGTNKFATLTTDGFYLTTTASVPETSGIYFTIDGSRMANVGGQSGGTMYMVDVKNKTVKGV